MSRGLSQALLIGLAGALAAKLIPDIVTAEHESEKDADFRWKVYAVYGGLALVVLYLILRANR